MAYALCERSRRGVPTPAQVSPDALPLATLEVEAEFEHTLLARTIVDEGRWVLVKLWQVIRRE